MPEQDVQPSPLTRDDRLLIQTLANRLRRIMQDQEVDMIDVDRRDELGILANMVNRAAKELRNSRRLSAERQQELEARLDELRAAHETERRLTNTIKEISTPILNIHQSVLLLPLIGVLDGERAAHAITMLLTRINEVQAQVVILDITGVPTVDTHVANVLIQSARAAALLGARVILCGIRPEVAQVAINLGINLSALMPCHDLQAAIQQALLLTGDRIIRANSAR
jgi:rsbT co-antagonist protein RsbR